MNPQQHYESRRAHFEGCVSEETRRADRISDFRLGVFVLGIAVVLAAWWGYLDWLGWPRQWRDSWG